MNSGYLAWRVLGISCVSIDAWAKHKPKTNAITYQTISLEYDLLITGVSTLPYTYLRKAVNVVSHGSSNAGPTIFRVVSFTIFVIVLRSLPGRPAFSVKLNSEVLVTYVTCYQRTLTYGSVHVMPVFDRSEICVHSIQSAVALVFITTNCFKFR